MNRSEVTDPTCTETENKQIQVRPRPRITFQFNHPLFKNQTRSIVGVNDEDVARERKKARNSRLATDGNPQGTSLSCQPSDSSKTTNAQNIGDNSLTPNVKNDKQAANVSTKVENDNNNLASQIPNVNQTDNFTKNDKRTSYSTLDCPKPGAKSNAPAYKNVRQNVKVDNNNDQCPPETYTYQSEHCTRNDKRNSSVDYTKPSVKNDASSYNVGQKVERDNKSYQLHTKTGTYQASNGSESFENTRISKCDNSIEVPKDNVLGHLQISSGNSKEDSHSDDGWGAISQNGDYPEDVWGNEKEDDSHKQNKYTERSKTSSSSKCFQKVQHVEPRKTEAFNSTRPNCSTKKDLTDDRQKDNWGSSQHDTKGFNHRNVKRNDCPPSYVELKTTNRQGYSTENKSPESENKEAYRLKSDFLKSKAHSYEAKNSSKTNPCNSSNMNPNYNASTPSSSNIKTTDKQDICVKNKNEESESGWPDLDDDRKSSCNDDCSWENSKVNQKKVKSEEPKSHERSYSKPYSNSPNYSNNRKDEKDNECQHEISNLQREIPKANLSRSTSFTDRTNNRFSNGTASAYNTSQSFKTENHGIVDSNDRNVNRKDCASSHVELKTMNGHGYFAENNSRGSENKEAYRPKSDFHKSNARSYEAKNSSKTNPCNPDNMNPNYNAYTSSSNIKTIYRQDICNKNDNEESESGWPDLDDDRKSSCNDDWSCENSKVNQKEVKSEEPKSYERSYSTPYSHSQNYINVRKDGRGDEKSHEFPPENSKMQREFPKANLGRSTSFTDRTNNRVPIRNATAFNANQSCKTENRGRVDSNESTISNTKANNWHDEPTHSDKQANSPVSVGQKLKSLGSNKLTTQSSSNNDETKAKRNSFLKCVNQSIAEDDKWNLTTDIVVLEEDSIKTTESKRVVIGNSMDDIKVIVSCRKEPDNIDVKSNQNFSEKDGSPQLSFSDPLEDDFNFFDGPGPFIPAPQPPSAFVQLDYSAASNSQVAEQSLESQKNAVKLSTSEAMLKGIPDARHIHEITFYLTQLETEKSVPLETSKKIHKDIIKALDHSSQSSWEKDFVHIYGSYVSGLAVSTSNINFAVKTSVEIKSKQANSYLLHMQRGFLNALKGYQVEPFYEETNPKKSKICFTETNSGIPCELGFYNSAVSKYLIMNKMLHNICEFDQRIKTLLIATRIWAEVCLIHEAEEGKLHPVGYSLLMLHFLQGLDKPLLPILNMDSSIKNWGLLQLEEKNESSVGELWLAFLKYYSEFNWRDNAITINTKTAVSKSSKSWELSFIAIEDPFTQDNIGDSVVSEQSAECIFACFKVSYEYFSTPVDYEDSDSSDSGINENSNCFKKDVFSFNHISFDQNIPTVCEKCEELDETCNKCRPRKEVIAQPLPELSEASLECVNRTLYDVYNEFRLPQSETEKRIAFVKILESDVKKMFPAAKLKLFGSSVNGFGFKKSDIDICMTFNDKLESNREINGVLRQIVRFLRRRPNLYENVYGLYHAKIPIVKFHVIQQDWHCDLSLCNILAVHNSKLLWKYSLYDERCCVLGCALKLLAKKACLDDTRHLSSYSYILTVIHYLQQVQPPVLPVFTIDHKEVFDENLMIPKEAMDHCNYWLNDKIENLQTKWYPLDPKNKNESSAGQLWLGLLDFYARYDDTYAITITQKEPLLSTNLRRCARLLNIQDPFLEKDNLGCILHDIEADETRKVLTRARLLFGKEIPKEHKAFPKRYFFSSSYLTGRPIKEIECDGCGGFGHQKSKCLKADPFKRSKFKIRVPKAKYPQKLKT